MQFEGKYLRIRIRLQDIVDVFESQYQIVLMFTLVGTSLNT